MEKAEVEQKLKECSEKIGMHGYSMTLDDLIGSFLNVRERYMRRSSQEKAEYERWYQLGMERGYKEVTEGEYIKRETLQKMSVAELIDYLHDDCDD